MQQSANNSTLMIENINEQQSKLNLDIKETQQSNLAKKKKHITKVQEQTMINVCISLN